MKRDQSPRGVPAPAATGLTVRFDRTNLYELRSSVAAHASELGIAPERLTQLLVVATELATNAVRHGGGRGELHLWAAGGTLHCQVRDRGRGINDLDNAGRERTPITGDGSRGLWVVREFSDDVHLANTSPGLTVTASFGLP